MNTLIALAALLTIYVIWLYNRLVFQREQIKKNWANIDVLFKQRHDELPKLVDVCQAFMAHEKEIFTSITALRNQAENPQQNTSRTQQIELEGEISSQVAYLFARAEAYPDIKSSPAFVQLSQRISDLENSIADRRELFNQSTTIFNTQIKQFPDLWLAKAFKLNEQPLYEVEKADTIDRPMAELFKD